MTFEEEVQLTMRMFGIERAEAEFLVSLGRGETEGDVVVIGGEDAPPVVIGEPLKP